MLLEVLSDFQISIPELGVVEARTQPLVLLTSNNSRELTEALKRRCLYLWLDYPDVERELEIVQLHAPELDQAIARKLVEVVHMVRALDLKKPPSIAESIDWARALLLLGAEDIDRSAQEDDVDHRQAPDRPRPRGRARRGEAGRWRRRARSAPAGAGNARPLRRDAGSARARRHGAAAARVRGRAAPRGRGRRHLRAARRLPGARRGELDLARGLPRGARRHARQVPGGPPRPRRALRPLLLPRRRARGGRAGPAEERFQGARSSTSRRCASASARRCAPASDGEMRDLARLAIAAFGRQGEGSGVIGVDVQRIRRTLGLRASTRAAELPDPDSVPRDRLQEFERTCAASSSAR